jgi:hypothetical protein
VHDGFYNALFGTAKHKESLRDGFSTLPNTVFSAALKALNEVRLFPALLLVQLPLQPALVCHQRSLHHNFNVTMIVILRTTTDTAPYI